VARSVTDVAGYRAVHQDAVHARCYDQQFWSPRSARALTWGLEQELLDLVLARDLDRRPSVAIDFACGTGRILSYLEGRAERTIGVDVSAQMLDLARRRCRRSQLIRHDVTEAPVPDLPAPVDLVTAFRFFLNAEPDLRAGVLDWMRGVLAPDGALVANFHLNPNSMRGLYLRARWAGRRRSPMLAPREVETILQAAGFRSTAYYGYEYLPYRRAGDRVLARRFRGRVEAALLDRPSLARLGGSFLVVARPQ
jgi:SAM-dependent methyltransferase